MNQIVPAGFKILASKIAIPLSIFIGILGYAFEVPQFAPASLNASIGPIFLSSRILNAFLLLAGSYALLAVLCYVNMRNTMIAYVEKSLKTDLSNIQQHYVKNSNTVFFVATIDDKVVGCVALDRVEGRSHLTDAEKEMIREDGESRKKGSWGELRRMSVDASIRRCGIATKLHDALMNFAKDQKLTGIFLTTSSLQGPAIEFYLKIGYKLKSSRGVPSKLMSSAIKLLTYDLEVSEVYTKTH